eukprot:scaffold1313_cov250-Pinguiococcus_pyrenoidosus.AAC.10
MRSFGPFNLRRSRRSARKIGGTCDSAPQASLASLIARGLHLEAAERIGLRARCRLPWCRTDGLAHLAAPRVAEGDVATSSRPLRRRCPPRIEVPPHGRFHNHLREQPPNLSVQVVRHPQGLPPDFLHVHILKDLQGASKRRQPHDAGRSRLQPPCSARWLMGKAHFELRRLVISPPSWKACLATGAGACLLFMVPGVQKDGPWAAGTSAEILVVAPHRRVHLVVVEVVIHDSSAVCSVPDEEDPVVPGDLAQLLDVEELSAAIQHGRQNGHLQARLGEHVLDHLGVQRVPVVRRWHQAHGLAEAPGPGAKHMTIGGKVETGCQKVPVPGVEGRQQLVQVLRDGAGGDDLLRLRSHYPRQRRCKLLRQLEPRSFHLLGGQRGGQAGSPPAFDAKLLPLPQHFRDVVPSPQRQRPEAVAIEIGAVARHREEVASKHASRGACCAKP